MGKVQAFRYLTELGDLGKQWAQEKGITSKEELDKWVEKARSKARSGKGVEKKQAREAVQHNNLCFTMVRPKINNQLSQDGSNDKNSFP